MGQDSSSSDDYARQLRKIERAAIREKNMWSTRRQLRAGEVRRIVELRYGVVGSMEETGMRIVDIAKKVLVNRKTVKSVCSAYLHRGGTIRRPDKHWREG